jgi:phosphoribosylformylglycinamidine (FGAM) synthase-like enzyme
VCECAANLACVGAEPLGLTNCLNFGNPEKPHVAWQLKCAVEGMAAACSVMGVPVVGGNVSLYNEGPAGPIYPTPVVGMVGELPAPGVACPSGFTAPAGEPDAVALIGPFTPSLLGSEARRMQGEVGGELAPFDLAAVTEALAAVREAVRAGTLHSAHDVSDGGLAACIAEAAILGGAGAQIDLEPLMRRADVGAETALFGEGPGGILVSGPREDLLALSRRISRHGFLALGHVSGDSIAIGAGIARIDLSVEEAIGLYRGFMEQLFSSAVTDRVP